LNREKQMDATAYPEGVEMTVEDQAKEEGEEN
jgi:hypothetical protein